MNRSTSIPEAQTEFDILDGWPGKTLVEGSQTSEPVLAHGAAASPKSARAVARPLMNKTVQEVTELAHYSWRAGPWIVRTHDCVQLGGLAEFASRSELMYQDAPKYPHP